MQDSSRATSHMQMQRNNAQQKSFKTITNTKTQLTTAALTGIDDDDQMIRDDEDCLDK